MHIDDLAYRLDEEKVGSSGYSEPNNDVNEAQFW